MNDNNNIRSLTKKREEKQLEKEKQGAPSSEVVKLWRLSLAMDELIKSGVLDDNLSLDEIATILANRLGSLIHCTDNPKQLAQFCISVIERMNKGDEPPQDGEKGA